MHLWIKDAEKTRENEYHVGESSLGSERELASDRYLPDSRQFAIPLSSKRLQSDTDITSYLKEPRVARADSRDPDVTTTDNADLPMTKDHSDVGFERPAGKPDQKKLAFHKELQRQLGNLRQVSMAIT